MRRLPYFVAALAIACFSFSISGCEPSSAPGDSATTTDDHGHDHDGPGHEGHEDHDDHGHDHSSSNSPHGGQIIDLGRDGEYHAEMTDNHDNESITIYMLDAKMESTKIDASSISLTLMSGDNAQTFEMTSVSKEGDAGSSFCIEDETAFDLLESEGTEGKLRVEIDGKPFTGSFEHHEH